MSRHGSSGGSALAGFAAAGFTVALIALVSAQLALMSVLDTDRAVRAAEQIAQSRFTTSIIERTVVRALAPIAGADLAQQGADAASADPNVVGVIETSLVDAHRQIVDRDAPVEFDDGNVAVGSAIVTSVIDTAEQNGVDLAALGLGDSATGGQLDPTAIATDAGLPQIVPDDIPRLGLRQVAETTRWIAFIAACAFALVAVLAHPRPGRSLRRIGATVAIVTGTWLVAMLVAGWVIGAIADTLFGEMIESVWSEAVPSMILLVGAGVAIGIALVLGGIALDGYSETRDGARRPSRRRSGRDRRRYDF